MKRGGDLVSPLFTRRTEPRQTLHQSPLDPTTDGGTLAARADRPAQDGCRNHVRGEQTEYGHKDELPNGSGERHTPWTPRADVCSRGPRLAHRPKIVHFFDSQQRRREGCVHSSIRPP